MLDRSSFITRQGFGKNEVIFVFHLLRRHVFMKCTILLLQFACNFHVPISGPADRASATETIDSGSIPGRAKPKTIKTGIYSFMG